MTKPISITEMPDTSEDDAPPLTQADFDRAGYLVSGKDATLAEWQSAVQGSVTKLRISIMLDAPIVAHFKAMAGDRGYQTLINDTLRRSVDSENFVRQVRYVLREELASLRGDKK